jgi:hypothetical protein
MDDEKFLKSLTGKTIKSAELIDDHFHLLTEDGEALEVHASASSNGEETDAYVYIIYDFLNSPGLK